MIITTYRRPDALDGVLRCLESQTLQPKNVIVADDGSCQKTTAMVLEWRERLPLIHVWQPDREFRAARIRNLGLLKVSSDAVALVDGDCLLPSTFLAGHVSLLRRGRLIAGGRDLMDAVETEEFMVRSFSGIQSRMSGWKFWRVPLGFVRYLSPRRWQIVRTCNMSMMMSDVWQVGGFDETYVGWGREDSDFIVRAIKSGCRVVSGRLSACVLHLWHAESDRAPLKANEKRFNDLLAGCRSTPAKSVLGEILQ